MFEGQNASYTCYIKPYGRLTFMEILCQYKIALKSY